MNNVLWNKQKTTTSTYRNPRTVTTGSPRINIPGSGLTV